MRSGVETRRECEACKNVGTKEILKEVWAS